MLEIKRFETIEKYAQMVFTKYDGQLKFWDEFQLA